MAAALTLSSDSQIASMQSPHKPRNDKFKLKFPAGDTKGGLCTGKQKSTVLAVVCIPLQIKRSMCRNVVGKRGEVRTSPYVGTSLLFLSSLRAFLPDITTPLDNLTPALI